MLGKGVSARDVLLSIVAVVVGGGALGALLGWAQNQFGLSAPMRTGIIVIYAVVAGRFVQAYVRRRAKERLAQAPAAK